MHVLQRIIKKFQRKKAFIIDNTECLEREVNLIESKNISTDGFSDCNTFFYNLRKKKCRYSFGLVRENGSKYASSVICNFIKQTNPDIKLYTYKNEDDFAHQTSRLILT